MKEENEERARPGPSGPTRPTDDELSAASLRAAQIAGGVMGATVIWDLGQMLVPVVDVQRLAEASGLNALIIPAPTKGAVLAKALRNLGDAGLVEEVTRGGERVTYQLTSRVRDRENDRLRYAERYKITWYRDGVPEGLAAYQRGPDPIIVFADNGEPAGDETDARLRELVDRYRDCYVARDVAYYVLRPAIDRNDAILLRRNGGAYFIPAPGMPVLDNLRTFIKALADETGVTCQFYALAAPLDPDTRDTVATAAMEDLRQRFASLEVRLAVREAKSDKVRVDTAQAKRAEIMALLEQTRRYAAMCRADMTELEEYAARLDNRAYVLERVAAARPDATRRGRRARPITRPSPEFLEAAQAVAQAYSEDATNTPEPPSLGGEVRRSRRPRGASDLGPDDQGDDLPPTSSIRRPRGTGAR